MKAELCALDRALVSMLQDAFPLTERPYATLGQRLGASPDGIMARIEQLKRDGLVRQIGAIFATERLGYRSTLAALRIDPALRDAVADGVSRHPGVSHNYARAHTYNLWFTLAVPPGADLEGEVRRLAQQPGVLGLLLLPRERTFKIDARFSVADDEGSQVPADAASRPAVGASAAILAKEDVPYVRALQKDLPLVARPFDDLAARVGVSPRDLLAAARRFREEGIMRRYGATLRHRRAGYVANAMVCWEVEVDRLEEAGAAAAGHGAVSHCYARPAHPPHWPYRLFTMVHARSPAELEGAVGALADAIDPMSHAVLHTVHEYKKVRLRYFSESEEGP